MLLLALALASLFSTPPTVENDDWQPDERQQALENPELFGGDMIADPERMLGNGMVDTKYRWPGYPGAGTIPYVIDSSLSGNTKDIEKAMKQYHDHTCIKFVKRTDEKNYLKIFKGNGCYSYVGMDEDVKQPQPLSLGKGCMPIGTIVHELGHAIGFYHEQNRSDRDDYLNIYLENVIPGMKGNFKKLKADENILINDFDYDSIMIYGNTAFSRNRRNTMEAKNGRKLTNPFDKSGLNDSDIERVNKLYKCGE